jgi:hypothetical protein
MLDFTSIHHYCFMQDRLEKSGAIVLGLWLLKQNK